MVVAVFGWPVFYLSHIRSFELVHIPVEDYAIKGNLSTGTNPEGPFVILVHGNRGEGVEHKLYKEIANNLNLRITVLAINLSGFGEFTPNSQSANNRSSAYNRSDEILAAVEFIKERFGVSDDRIVLIGHSLGAAQISYVAANERFRMAIPVGLGNYERVINSSKVLEQYAEKIHENTAVEVDKGRLLSEIREFTPEALFSTCPLTPVAFVFGSLEYDRLIFHEWYEKLSEECNSRLYWIIIPFSNHMYWTESTKMPQPIQQLQSDFSVSLLVYKLNQLLRN